MTISEMLFERGRWEQWEEWLQFDPACPLDTNAGIWVVDSADLINLPCNAVSVKSTSGIEHCVDFFKQFPIVFVAIADDDVSAEIESAFSKWIVSTPVFKPREGAFGDRLNITDIIANDGAAAVDGLLKGMKPLPVAGLISLADAKKPDEVESVLSGLSELDRCLGGLTPGEVTVITGRRGEGKSTFVNQILLEAIEQGRKCCIFSGELTPWRVRQWITAQCAGKEYLTQKTDQRSGLQYTVIDSWAEALIVQWLSDKLVLTNNATAQTIDAILELWEAAAARGYSVFAFDNIMAAASSGADLYQSQSELLGKLVKFAHRWKAVVLCVAHPRKAAAGSDERPITSASEVGGSGDIANRADNVICVCRLNEEDRRKYDCDVVLNILKNRAWGFNGKIKLFYDSEARRFYRRGDAERVYSWRPTQQTIVEVSEDDTPF